MKNILFLLLAAGFSGCYYDVEEELYPSPAASCDTTGITYSGKIEPLLAFNCYVCHSAAIAEGGVVLEGYQNVLQYAGNGKLLSAVTHEAGTTPMPKGGSKLPVCDIEYIRNWINQGTPDN